MQTGVTPGSQQESSAVTTLSDLGFSDSLESYRSEHIPAHYTVGRVCAEHKERYVVATGEAEYDAEITGNMRFSATGREDFPAVGDWVAVMTYDQSLAIIHTIFPRSSVIKRKAAGSVADVQIIAANVDTAFILQAVDRDFSINRLERYLTLCYAGNVTPVIILSKIDLLPEDDVAHLTETIHARLQGVEVAAISNQTGQGIAGLRGYIHKGKTYCLLGSSGVGKSTLINTLAGTELMKTSEISEKITRGKHTTSHRQLFVLEQGGIFIDNPGMREVGLADAESGLEATFDQIMQLAQECRFSDCTHTTEIGCRVLSALESGELEAASYQNYLKMMKEQAYFDTTSQERKRKEKIMGKVIKEFCKKNLKRKSDN